MFAREGDIAAALLYLLSCVLVSDVVCRWKGSLGFFFFKQTNKERRDCPRFFSVVEPRQTRVQPSYPVMSSHSGVAQDAQDDPGARRLGFGELFRHPSSDLSHVHIIVAQDHHPLSRTPAAELSHQAWELLKDK